MRERNGRESTLRKRIRMILRELITVLGFDVKDEPLKKMESSMEHIKETMHRILEVYVGEKIIHGLIDGIREFGEVAHEVIDAQLLGLGAVQYQVLQHTAEMFGVQRQRFNMGLALMQRQAFEAMRGNKEAAETFARLGVSITDNNGQLKNAQTLLYGIANGMQNIKDKTERLALGEKLFCMGDIEFQNMLQGGAAGLKKMSDEAIKLGFAMSEKDAAAAEEMYKNFIRLRMVMEGFRNALFSQLAPLVNQMANDILKWVEANQALIKTKIKEFAEGVISVAKTLWAITMQLINAFTLLAKGFGGAGNAVKFLIYSFLGMIALDIGGKIVSMIGFFITLTKTIYGVTAALRIAMLGMGGLLGWLGALVATVTMLWVIIKDIVGFFQGKNSLTGVLVHSIKNTLTGPSSMFSGSSNLTDYAKNRAATLAGTSVGGHVITMDNRTNVTVHGAGNPHETALAVGAVMDKHTKTIIKNANRILSPRTSH